MNEQDESCPIGLSLPKRVTSVVITKWCLYTCLLVVTEHLQTLIIQSRPYWSIKCIY